ncbi:hypothetical protein [Agathobaculum sp.]|uniref:hypothetical protein n=1 Tax=Agathobaculum sp. TaxID=2048138 RepID=UPI002A818E89|nr:hypothetical protein [Agathobaculum sp.]MDY3618206.1 hypothetical protein [Agathobaculum sp.]
MSEPNDKLEEQTEAETNELSAVPAESEDQIVLTPEEAEEEIEEDLDPSEIRIFGLPRICFHGAALGVALGYILTGLIGMALDKMGYGDKMPSATIMAIICAGIGYLITKRMYNKRKAEKEQQNGEV